MSNSRFVATLFILVPLATVYAEGSGDGADGRDAGQQLKQRVLSSRAALADGVAEFETVDPTGRQIRWVAWFKGRDRLRVDRDDPPRKMLRLGEDQYSWSHSEGGPLVQPVRRSIDDPVRDVFDFRLLGTVFTATSFHNSKLGENLAQDSGTVDPEMENVDWDGKPVKLVTTRYPTGAVLRQWIDPERGPSIVHAELEATSEKSGRHYRDQLDVRLHNYDGVWFPDHIVYTRYVNHSPIGSVYVTHVERAEFDTGLSEELFSLTALGVPEGLDVQEFPPHPNGQRVWDGQQLVLADPPPARAVTPQSRPFPTRTLVVVNLLAGVTCFCVFVYLRFRRRSDAAKSG